MKRLMLDDTHLAFLDAIFELAIKHSEKAARPYINTIIARFEEVSESTIVTPEIVS